jgi:carboxymethylenebutenolidase
MSVQGEMIEIGGMPAYVARPAGAGPSRAVLVIQEAFGLNEHIKDVARRVAGEGYVALAPDLFHRGGKGRVAGYDDLPKALTLMGELKDDDIVADVASAIAHLAKDPGVRRGGVGITGFCMGGRVSYLAACALPDQIAAAVPYYGGGIPIDRTPTLRAPVLAFFGDADPFIPLDSVEKLRSEAKRLGKDVEIVVYPGAPHGFFCNERDSYRPDAARDAWERTKVFFKRHLAG